VAFSGFLVEQPNLVGGGSDRGGGRNLIFTEELYEHLWDDGGNVRRVPGSGKLRRNSNLHVVLVLGTAEHDQPLEVVAVENLPHTSK